ncbi:MAG: protein kinase [Bryobacterales bacterium]|nr:protein kinase [Bryobacterales bacterium]
MTQDRWQEVERIFHDALQYSGVDRIQFVESACGPDHNLRGQVRELLDAHERPGTFEGDEAAVLASELLHEEEPGRLAGRSLSHYRLHRLLGSGGMGEVYLAVDLALERAVALKVLPSALAGDADFLSRFEIEARAASALNHPNIATIHELDRNGDTQFIVMEYVEGETLEARILRGAIEPETIRELALQIASALEEAHGKGVLHRDLKPSNLMITPKGHVKLIDFGLARLSRQDAASAVPRLTVADTVMGTHGYLSPEQLTGSEVDARSDIFSFGAVLFEMATGRSPFRATNVPRTIANVLQAEPDGISACQRLGPSWLWSVIGRCLEKDPRNRYQSAGELRLALESRLGGAERRSGSLIGRRWFLAGAVPASVLAGGLLWRFFSGRSGNPSHIRSLAVLPLAHPAGAADQEYFSDGMTEALIGEIGRIENLRVISSTSVMQYKTAPAPLREVVRKLAVEGIVEGSVLRSADRIRISVRLVNAVEDRQLWSQSFEGSFSNVLELQREVAREVAHRISQRLAAEKGVRSSGSSDVPPQAYDSYLRGIYHWNRRTRVDLEKAIAHFEQTIRLAPRYVPAHVGLANSYSLLAPLTGVAPLQSYPKSEAAARTALRIDERSGEAHSALGVVLHEYHWDHAGAEAHFRRAIELSPNYAPGRQWYAELLIRTRRSQEGVELIQQALALDPVSLPVNAVAGWILHHAGRRPESIAQLKKAIALDPKFTLARGYLGRVLIAQNQSSQAIAEFEVALSLSNGAIRYRAELAAALALSGRRRDAEKHLRVLIRQSAGQYVPRFLMATVYMAFGKREQAIVSLQQAAGERGVWSLLANIEPIFEPLHGDPRFQAVLKSLGFSAYLRGRQLSGQNTEDSLSRGSPRQ